MDRRRNALVGAAMLAVAVNEVGWTYHATEGKATVAGFGALGTADVWTSERFDGALRLTSNMNEPLR